VALLLRESPVSPGTLSATLRRIARPRGAISQRQMPAASATSLLERMNDGRFSPAPPLPLPSRVNAIGRVAASLVLSWVTPGVLRFLKLLPVLLLVVAIVAAIVAIVLFAAGGLIPAVVIAAAIAVVAAAASVLTRRFVQKLEARVALRDGSLSGAAL